MRLKALNQRRYFKYQYIIVFFLGIALAKHISIQESPFIPAVLYASLILGLLVIAKPIYGLYIIIGGVCLSGGLVSVEIGGKTITFFSDLPLPLNFNLFELVSIGMTGILYALISLKKEVFIFEETRISHALWAFSSAVTISWLSYSITVGGFENLYELRRLLYIILVFVLMINLIETENQLWFIVKLFIIFVSIKSLLGLFEAVVFDKPSFLYPTWHESIFFLTVFFIYIGLKDHCLHLRFTREVSLLLIPIGLCFLFSTRRTLWASLLVVLLLYFLFWKRGSRLRFLGFLVCAAILFIIAIIASSSEELVDELYSLRNPLEAHTFILRQWEWENAWEYIKSKPLLGHGLGSILIPIVDFKYIFRTGFTSIIFHNNYLWIWVKGGLFALVPLLFLMFISLRESYRLYKKSSQSYNRAILLGIFLSIVNFAISGFISPTLADLQINAWLGFCLGVIALIKRFERENSIKGQIILNQ